MYLESPPGFPTLLTLPHTPFIKHIGVNIFGGSSRKETLAVQCDNVSTAYSSQDSEEVDRAKIQHQKNNKKSKKGGEQQQQGEEEAEELIVDREEVEKAKNMIGGIAFVDWPHFREAKVSGVSTQQVCFNIIYLSIYLSPHPFIHLYAHPFVLIAYLSSFSFSFSFRFFNTPFSSNTR